MSACIVTTSFREWAWIRALKAQAKKAGLEFLHTPAASSWHGGEFDVMGYGAFGPEHAQRNYVLDRAWFKGYEWAITLDADEVLTLADFKALCAFLEALPKEKTIVLAGRMDTYFKSADWRVTPRESHAPVLAVRRSTGEPFRENRCVKPGLDMERWEGGTLHHFSWARPEHEIVTKLKTFSHAPEVRQGWYEEVWQKWTPGYRDFHPLGDGKGYPGVCLSEAPEEIRNYWRRATGIKLQEAT